MEAFSFSVKSFKRAADEYHKKVESFANSYQNKLKSDLKSGKVKFVFGEDTASSVDNDPNRDSLYYYVDTNNPER